jgi:hypothetical protein
MNNTGEASEYRVQGKDKIVESTQTQFRDLPVAALLKQLQTSAGGLDKAEAERRLDKYGYNELSEKKPVRF